MWVECFCTVGVTNAVRAGEPASHDGRSHRCDRIGTINIILVTNATLAVPAMVGAVQGATESKTAALVEKHVRSSSGLHFATGTGTDAIVVASSLDGRHRVQYSGTHTGLGSMIENWSLDACMKASIAQAAGTRRSVSFLADHRDLDS